MIYELEQMWKDAVASYLKVILLVHISSEATGDHFENAQSGQLSYPTRFTTVTAGMLSEPPCSGWPSELRTPAYPSATYT
jgi:hypothetical protein